MIQTIGPLYKRIASAIVARKNCQESGNAEWFDRWTEELREYAKCLPHGSGFDNGTSIDLDRSDGKRIVLNTSFHHMNENGYYDGWTEHVVTVKADLLFDFMLTISGPDRNGWKEYAYTVFQEILSEKGAESL